MQKLAQLLPLLLKLAPIVMGVVATNNWSALASPEGRDLIQSILYVFLPAAAGVASAGGALYLDSREKQAALMADPPVTPTETEDAVQVNAGGVKLSLRVDRTAGGDSKFRESVVEMVKSSLAVRTAEVKP